MGTQSVTYLKSETQTIVFLIRAELRFAKLSAIHLSEEATKTCKKMGTLISGKKWLWQGLHVKVERKTWQPLSCQFSHFPGDTKLSSATKEMISLTSISVQSRRHIIRNSVGGRNLGKVGSLSREAGVCGRVKVSEKIFEVQLHGSSSFWWIM